MNTIYATLKAEFILDDNIHSKWFSLQNWVSFEEYNKLSAKQKSFYVIV